MSSGPSARGRAAPDPRGGEHGPHEFDGDEDLDADGGAADEPRVLLADRDDDEVLGDEFGLRGVRPTRRGGLGGLVGQGPQVGVVPGLDACGQALGHLDEDGAQVLLLGRSDGAGGQELAGLERAGGDGAGGQVTGAHVGAGPRMRGDDRQHAVGAQVRPRGDVLGQDVDLLGLGGGVDRPGAQGDGGADEGYAAGEPRIPPGPGAQTRRAGAAARRRGRVCRALGTGATEGWTHEVLLAHS